MVRGKVPGAGRRLKRLCKWDGLSSDAQHTSKKSGMSMHACNPSRGKQVPGTHRPASLNYWIPDALRDPVSKESHKNYDGDDEDEKYDWGRCLNWPPHTHTGAPSYMHMPIHPCTHEQAHHTASQWRHYFHSFLWGRLPNTSRALLKSPSAFL